jgi:hypothetical protein
MGRYGNAAQVAVGRRPRAERPVRPEEELMSGMARLALPVLLLLAACSIETAAPADGAGAVRQVQAGDTVWLRAGQSAVIGRTGVQLVFREVVADSRCPIDAVCVWAGDAEVRLQARSGLGSWTTLVVHSYVEPRAAQYGAFTVRLLEVAPALTSTDRVQPGDYAVRLEITQH